MFLFSAHISNVVTISISVELWWLLVKNKKSQKLFEILVVLTLYFMVLRRHSVFAASFRFSV